MGCFSKFCLFTMNFFVVALGLCVVGVSGAILGQHSIFGVLMTNVFYSVPLSALLGGIFLTGLGLLGCFGAIKEHSCMLKLYSVVVGILMLGVLVIGIGMIILTTHASKYLVGSMTTVFNEYGEEGKEDLTYALDLIQNTFQCCGILGYKDWADFEYGNETNVADGCCVDQIEGCGVGMLKNPDAEDLVFTMGCLSFVVGAVYYISLALGILTLILVFFQTLSITWACIIAKDTKRHEKA